MNHAPDATVEAKLSAVSSTTSPSASPPAAACFAGSAGFAGSADPP
jgi:hypothetical protein